MILTGGYEITEVAWVGPESIEVSFRAESDTVSELFFQLYVNRRLAAVANAPSDRRLTGLATAGLRAAPIALLAVSSELRNVDHGHVFARRPWNRYRVTWLADDVPDDVARFDVCLSDPDESVQFTQVVARVERVPGKRKYFVDLPTLDQGTGTYEVSIVPRDRTSPLGNAGAETTSSIKATVYPLDFRQLTDGNRFSVNVTAGVLTTAFEWGVA